MVNVSQLEKNFDHAKTQQMEFFFDEVMPSQIKLAPKATANVKQLIVREPFQSQSQITHKSRWLS